MKMHVLNILNYTAVSNQIHLLVDDTGQTSYLPNPH